MTYNNIILLLAIILIYTFVLLIAHDMFSPILGTIMGYKPLIQCYNYIASCHQSQAPAPPTYALL